MTGNCEAYDFEGEDREAEFARLINDLRELGVEVSPSPEGYDDVFLVGGAVVIYENVFGVFYEEKPYSFLCNYAMVETMYEGFKKSIQLYLYRMESDTYDLSPQT